MNREKIIKQKLSVLNPDTLCIINNSHTHKGHAGNPHGENNTHFSIEISTNKLDSLSKIEQHRLINNLLKNEFSNGLHALSIKVTSKKAYDS